MENKYVWNTYVKPFSVFGFYLHVYETEQICVCIEKLKCGSGNTSVNPFADHEIQV